MLHVVLLIEWLGNDKRISSRYRLVLPWTHHRPSLARNLFNMALPNAYKVRQATSLYKTGGRIGFGFVPGTKQHRDNPRQLSALFLQAIQKHYPIRSPLRWDFFGRQDGAHTKIRQVQDHGQLWVISQGLMHRLPQ